eukprot:CAMPEP_0197621710 /NCGR_PEP_ID=MMETSP1338-20131121/2203_1 /TAXON_ID=43686 ORGANISM="Pelagodinium beii, Strain RCC1491" /NCGR_SAMPLE_ID=MMETSP1338 /ASSEMBLY_ACC=CAM_ASM_000754 /LENGTH=407 /DNA_ID=CAMNT_0043191241 /DNA_START=77 /DNA_END=1300 /DNA_ORIENTATION=+
MGSIAGQAFFDLESKIRTPKKNRSIADEDFALEEGCGAKSRTPRSSKEEVELIEQAAEEVKDETQKTSQSAAQTRVVALVICHAICASGLLIVNKWALKAFPFVWTLTTVQFGFAALVVFICGRLGLIQSDPLDLAKLKQFFPAAGMFFITITAGNAVVGVSNVDTFIVMRSVVPIPCAILESLILKEPCPCPLSWIGLCIILMGAFAYAQANQGVVVNSVPWVILFLTLGPLDGVLIKQLVSESSLSPWGLVLYNNVCAVIPGLFFATILEISRESVRQRMSEALQSPSTVCSILLSSFAGLAISYFQLNVRKAISSTAFMVLGVSNKLLSVLMNQFAMLDTNNSVPSIASVLVSIFGAIFFQQSVKGKGISQAPKKDSASSGTTASIFVVVGLLAAAKISLDQQV